MPSPSISRRTFGWMPRSSLTQPAWRICPESILLPPRIASPPVGGTYPPFPGRSSSRSRDHVAIHVPAGSVANDLGLSVHIVLAALGPPSADPLTARHIGARLASSPTTIYLEGSASRFPTEAISFSAAHMEEAAWSVRTRFDDLRESFAGSVRLLLNSDHPIGAGLASMDETIYGAAGSFLRLDIIRALIGAVADHLREAGFDRVPLDEDSVGAVVTELCAQYMGRDFASIAELRRSDPERFERVLQEGVGVGIGGAR